MLSDGKTTAALPEEGEAGTHLISQFFSSSSDGGMLAVLKEMMNFKLLADPLFFLIGISNAFAMIGFYTPFVYLPNMAIVTGVSVADASFLVSVMLVIFSLECSFVYDLQVIGISNTLGRVLAGWVSDFSWVGSLIRWFIITMSCHHHCNHHDHYMLGYHDIHL